MAVNDNRWFLEHVERYRSDPTSAHDWDSAPVGGDGIVPTLLLRTSGSRTGSHREIPLMYLPCGGGFIVIGSRGGSRRHPGWYHNLMRNPHCSAQVGCMAYGLRAEALEGDQRDRYWGLMTRFWPMYLDYQAQTQRRIPVVKLHITQASGPIDAVKQAAKDSVRTDAQSGSDGTDQRL